MKHWIKKIFHILVIAILVITIIVPITFKILVKPENMEFYYLYRFVASTHFITATKHMVVQDFSAGRIYYKNNLENSNIKLIDESIQKGANDSNKYFGQAKSYPLRVTVFSTTEEYKKAFRNAREGHYDTYSIYLSLEDITAYKLIHEYTHFKVESFCRDKRIPYFAMPAWFNEGIAEYISFQYRRDKADMVSLDKPVDFGELKIITDFQEAYNKGYPVYFQSYLAIKKIVELKGEKCLQNILLDSKKMDFDSAFMKNTSISIEKLQELLK